jgi:probable addiction module antidote protein
MAEKITNFDIAEQLKFDADIRAFLQEVAETGDSSDLIHALNIVARAKGMSKLATEMGVSRTSLYKSLSGETSPGFDTINQLIQALGYRLEIVEQS